MRQGRAGYLHKAIIVPPGTAIREAGLAIRNIRSSEVLMANVITMMRWLLKYILQQRLHIKIARVSFLVRRRSPAPVTAAKMA